MAPDGIHGHRRLGRKVGGDLDLQLGHSGTTAGLGSSKFADRPTSHTVGKQQRSPVSLRHGRGGHESERAEGCDNVKASCSSMMMVRASSAEVLHSNGQMQPGARPNPVMTQSHCLLAPAA